MIQNNVNRYILKALLLPMQVIARPVQTNAAWIAVGWVKIGAIAAA
jgi:hypothetical protein